ncbi:MAG: hypothetical protein HQK53_08975 [Oligoflexia bacterium]|nr:hypothetical protein [Oligoflexia bacterium]
MSRTKLCTALSISLIVALYLPLSISSSSISYYSSYSSYSRIKLSAEEFNGPTHFHQK